MNPIVKNANRFLFGMMGASSSSSKGFNIADTGKALGLNPKGALHVVKQAGQDIVHGHLGAAAHAVGSGLSSWAHHSLIGKQAAATTKGAKDLVAGHPVKAAKDLSKAPTSQAVAKRTGHLAHDVSSTIASAVAKCISALFWSLGIFQFMQQHSIAATIFRIVDTNTKNGALVVGDNLNQIVNNNPLGLIFDQKNAAIWAGYIGKINAIFVVFMLALLIGGFVINAAKLPISVIFNNPQMRTQSITGMVRAVVSVILVGFEPILLGIACQLDGAILMVIANTAQSLSIGGHSLWTIMCTMGVNVQNFSDVAGKSVSGFIFNFVFLLANIGITFWVFGYYIYRQISFVWLYLSSFIQIPSMMFDGKANSFWKWVQNMFSTIFIQDIHAFALMTLAVFWGAQQEVGANLDDPFKNFTATMFMMVTLLLFQPLTRAIARQLNFDTNMTDILTGASSNAMRGVASSAATTGMIGINGMLHAGAAASHAVGAAIGAGADMMVPGGKDRLLAAGARHGLNMETKNQLGKMMGNLKGLLGDAQDLTGVMWGTAELAGANGEPNPVGANLEPLSRTRLGGYVSNNHAAVLRQNGGARGLGINKADGKPKDGGPKDGGKPTGGGGGILPGGGPDARARGLSFMAGIFGGRVHGQVSQAISRNLTQGAPTGSNAKAGQMMNWARNISGSQAARAGRLTPAAQQMGWHHYYAQNHPQDINQAQQEFYSNPDLMRQHFMAANMEHAIKTAGGDPGAPNVNAGQTMSAFQDGLEAGGYTPDQANTIAHSMAVPTMAGLGGISRDGALANNGGYASYGNVPTGTYAGANAGPVRDYPSGSHYVRDWTEAPAMFDAGADYTMPKTTAFSINGLYDQVKDSRGYVPDGAVNLHVTNGSSYLTAQDPHGGVMTVSGFGAGDPNLEAGQEFVQPMSFGEMADPNAPANAEPFMYKTLQPASESGTFYNHLGQGQVEQTPPSIQNAVRQIANRDFDYWNNPQGSDHGYISYGSIPAANNVVDRGGYDMAMLAADDHYKDFALDGNKYGSYISAYDTNSNQRVRISPMMDGATNLGEHVGFTAPLNYGEDAFSTQGGAFKFSGNSQATATEQDVAAMQDWLAKVNLSQYMRQVPFNQNNWLANHEGAQNIGQVSTFGS